MEDRTYKQLTAIILSILILGVAYFGSYRPMRKAQSFISTLQSLQTTPPSSLDDLESRLTPPLNYYSPIGQEEIVRNLANSVLSFIQSSQSATSTAALVQFLDGYYDPILERGKGMSFGQDLYLAGAINEIAFAGTGDTTYLAAAQQWYEEAHTLGPNRPQSLYGLFDVYRAEGDVTDTVMTANEILANWPSDTRIASSVQEFLGAAGVGAPTN